MSLLKAIRKYWPALLLAGVLLLGLELRLSHLGSVQKFNGDQGRDYLVVMDWLQHGTWPLLGPWRSVSQDRTIGPGWFYTIAPALALSGFHPCAGAALISILGILTALLSSFWIWRTTGSRLAAIAVALIWALAANWVADQRVLWNPHILPFGLIAMACLIQGLERRPLPCLGLLLMLCAILPQWHSTGMLLVLAGLPFAALATFRARELLKQSSTKAWLGWGCGVLLVILLLYVPPLIYEYELLPGRPSNLKGYFSRSVIPSPPTHDPLTSQLSRATDRMIGLVAQQTFSRPFPLSKDIPAWTTAIILAILFLGIYGKDWIKSWRQVALSPAYLATFLAGNWFILVLKDKNVLDYFLHPVLPVPLLLAGWTVGRLLGRKSLLARGCGLLLILGGLILTLRQFPEAWAIQHGRVVYGQSFAGTRKIAKYVVENAGAKPFGVLLVDDPRMATLPIHYLVRYLGHPSSNLSINTFNPIPKKCLGERFYLVVRGKMDPQPRFAGPSLPLGPPLKVADALIYCIPATSFPANLRTLLITTEGEHWTIKGN